MAIIDFVLEQIRAHHQEAEAHDLRMHTVDQGDPPYRMLAVYHQRSPVRGRDRGRVQLTLIPECADELLAAGVQPSPMARIDLGLSLQQRNTDSTA